MGNMLASGLATLLFKMGFYKKNAKVILLGLDNAGKTSLLHRMTTGSFKVFTPTQRAREDSFQIASVNFKAWDLGGHETVRYLWEDFLPDCTAVVFMVDSADELRLEEAQQELESLMEIEAMADIPLVILFNKTDLKSALPTAALMDRLQLEPILAKKKTIRTFRCSILRDEGYREGLTWLGSQV